MKKRLVLLFIAWLSAWSVAVPQTCKEWLLTVNQPTGVFTILDSIRQDCWVLQGSEFFNSYTHRYHFQGKRNTGGNRLYTVQPGVTSNPVYDSLTPLITGCNYVGGASNDFLNKNYTLAVVTNTAGVVSQLSVDSIDPATSSITPVLPIAALTGTNIAISQFLYDDAGNRFFLFYAHPAGGFRISVIDGANGSVLNTFSLATYVFNLQYDPASDLLYGLQSTAGVFSLVNIDPSSGTAITMTAVAGLVGNFQGSSLYKAQRWYSFFGVDGSGQPHLFTLDLHSGSVLYDIVTPAFATAACTPPAGMGIGNSTNGNMLMPAYDQSNGMLYCLHWGTLPQDIVTAIGPELQPAEWRLYPNPSADVVYIDGNEESEFTVELTDMAGRGLYKGKDTREISLGSFAPGIYRLRILSGRNVSTMKLVRSGN